MVQQIVSVDLEANEQNKGVAMNIATPEEYINYYQNEIKTKLSSQVSGQ